MAENDLLAFKIHIAVLDISNCTRSTTAIHKEIDNDPVAIFAEITACRRLFQQPQQFFVRIGFLDCFDLFIVWNIQCRIFC